MKSLFLALPPVALLLGACGPSTPAGDRHAHTEVAAEIERGPHGGRLLREGDFALELTLVEIGVSPAYHLYAYLADQPLAASQVQATIELSRLDGETNQFTFTPQGEMLVGQGTVAEPHSFDVRVQATHAGRSHGWRFASYEGRTRIPHDIAEAAGVRTAVAGPATIEESVALLGKVKLDRNRVAEVGARYEGIVHQVHASVGDPVRAGQTLAIMENRDSLRSFAVTTPINGTVLARHTNVGAVAGSAPLFEIADLSSLWVEFDVFGADVERLAAGQAVRIQATAGAQAAAGQLQRLLPLASAASQSVLARVVLPNPDGRWRPGMAVRGEVTLASHAVPLAVQRSGLQRFRDFTVVFAQVGETYEVRMLELGRQDAEHVEVLGGLKAGTRYVTAQSFLLKADIEKSGASHDH